MNLSIPRKTINMNETRNKTQLPKLNLTKNENSLKDLSSVIEIMESRYGDILAAKNIENKDSSKFKARPVRLPKLSQSYKTRVHRPMNASTRAKKNLESVNEEEKEASENSTSRKSSIASIKTPKPIIKKYTPTKDLNASSSSVFEKSIKKKVQIMQDAVPGKKEPVEKPILQSSTQIKNTPIYEFLPYEEYLERRQPTPVRAASPINDSIWPKEYYEVEEKPKDPMEKLNLKFGSKLSEDANYAMLKTYEDMIYFDLLSIYPNLKLSRTNTEFFKNVPRKFSSRRKVNKLPEIQNKPQPKASIKSNKLDVQKSFLTEVRVRENSVGKHKYTISRQLESAMKISDIVKEAKGEYVPSVAVNNLKSDNIISDFENWKKNWNSVLVE